MLMPAGKKCLEDAYLTWLAEESKKPPPPPPVPLSPEEIARREKAFARREKAWARRRAKEEKLIEAANDHCREHHGGFSRWRDLVGRPFYVCKGCGRTDDMLKPAGLDWDVEGQYFRRRRRSAES